MTKSNRLPVLAREIGAAHDSAMKAARAALDYALNCGALLSEAKAAVKHGAWGEWLAKNTPISERQAQKYMRLHRHRAEIEKTPCKADLTIDGALAALSRTKALAESGALIPAPGEYLFGRDEDGRSVIRIYESREAPGFYHWDALDWPGSFFEFSTKPVSGDALRNPEYVAAIFAIAQIRPLEWTAIPLAIFEPCAFESERAIQ